MAKKMKKKLVSWGAFFCWKCGEHCMKGEKNCPKCGALYEGAEKKKYAPGTGLGAGGIGWSSQTRHPSFKRFARRHYKAAFVWLLGMSILVPILIFAPGELEMDAEGLRILAIVLAIIWGFALCFLLSRYRSRPEWEGVVEGHRIEQRTRTKKDSGGNRYEEKYTVYIVAIRKLDGTNYDLTQEGSRDYDYFRVGDYLHFPRGRLPPPPQP